MRYRNIKTGAVIETQSVLGGNWVPVEEKKTAPAVKKKTTARTSKK